MQGAKIGLVDPVRTAKAFIPELRRREIDFVVIESGLMGTLEGEDVVRAPSIDLVAEALRAGGVTHVVGCVDPSITYADRLSAELGLSFSGLRRSEARRNKAMMAAAVRAAGLRVPKQREIHSEAELRAHLAAFVLPVVVKPVASGGTDNVHLCSTLDEAVAAYGAIFEQRNLMGEINRSVLVQEYIDGIEYVVDSVSFGGVHVPIDFFEYQKGTHNGRAFVYEKERFLRFEDDRSTRLWPFAQRVLDALEFRVGAGHMELKIDSRGEIVFIEIGPRLNGGDIFKIVRDTRADGKSQLDFAIDAAIGAPPPSASYRSAREGVRVYVIAEREGRLVGFDHLEEIEALASYTRTQWFVELGTHISRTTDMSSDVGWIDLTSADPVSLAADERRLDQILRRGVLRFA